MSANNDELYELWLTYKQHKTPAVRDQIITHYLSLVKLAAGRVAIGLPQHVDRDDLISSGFFGLLEAVDRFDPDRGVKFETYATTRIRGAILDALRAQDWVPNTLRQKARQYETTVALLENELGRAATDCEIALAMHLSVEQLHNLVQQLNVAAIIPLEDYLQVETASNQPVSPSSHIEKEEVRATLIAAIDRLPEKERLVVSLYYVESLTLKEISKVLNLSEARISQLHTKAIFRLRGALSRLKWSLL